MPKFELPVKIGSFILGWIIFPLILFWVGYSHVAPLFSGEFTQHLGSIEVSYITMAKFIERSGTAFKWQPLWYLGYPMQLLYTPLVPFFEFLSRIIFGWSYAHAYRVLTALSYCGVLVSFFIFGRKLFKNTLAALVAALSYGILPSIISLLYSEVASDTFSRTIIEPRRFTILVRWGEGPHIVSLMFLPLAALLWQRFLEKGSKQTLVGAGVFTALTVLTNSIGAYGLGILVFAIIIGEMSEGRQWWVTIGRAFLLGLTSFGLLAFWFNPLFLSTFFREGSSSMSFWKDQFPWGWLLIGAGLSMYTFLCKKIFGRNPGVTASLLYFLTMFIFVNAYYSSGSERLELVPQVLRLTTEVDLALALVIGSGVSLLGYWLAKIHRFGYYFAMLVVSLLLIPLFGRQSQLAAELPAFTQSLESIGKDITKTGEYEVAKHLEKKVTGNERVFVPGNYSFFLNYFSDIPQLRGALFQSSIHPWPDHIYYQITNGDSPKVTLAWLKIANVGWLVRSGPHDLYRDFKIGTQKFDEALTFEEEINGDRFYKVPLKNASLAKLVSPEILQVKPPFNAIDEPQLYRYVDVLEENHTALAFKGVQNGIYQISGPIDTGELILVQMSFAPGWNARDDRGHNLEVKRDPLGFILIKPQVLGPQSINLIYSQPLQVWIGWIASIVTLVLLIVMLIAVKGEVISSKAELASNPADIDDE